jgi:signal transduction histidine kinase
MLRNNSIEDAFPPQNFDQLQLSDIIDAEALQEMMDDYYALTGMGIGIIDLNGTVLVGTGWQEICVQFHRAVPESCRFCIESDISLSSGVAPGQFKEYRCKNNMLDIVTPIMLADCHIGNIFLGQFLYDDEEPDYSLFRQQALRFGYDEAEYIAALEKVPRFSRDTVQTAMSFYSKLAQMISKSNYNNVVLADSLSRSKRYEQELLKKNDELERFTYTVSHDLKSPVITIKGFTGSLEKDLAMGRYDRMAEDLKRVSTAADTMNVLLRDLQELSTIGRIIKTPEPVDMNELVHEVLLQLDDLVAESGVSVTVHPVLPTVTCDRGRIVEVWQNLLNNGIRFIGNSSDPKIVIGMREEEGERVYFVQDNGIGIDEKYHSVVFGLFNKLDAKSEGTGIGLTLAKRIIEVHGGKIWIESQGVGYGSRFCFTLPQNLSSL